MINDLIIDIVEEKFGLELDIHPNISSKKEVLRANLPSFCCCLIVEDEERVNFFIFRVSKMTSEHIVNAFNQQKICFSFENDDLKGIKNFIDSVSF